MVSVCAEDGREDGTLSASCCLFIFPAGPAGMFLCKPLFRAGGSVLDVVGMF